MNRYDIALGKKPPPKKAPEPAIELEKIYHLGIDIGLRTDPTAIAICHLSPGYESSIIRTTIDYLEELPYDMPDIIDWLRTLNHRLPIKRGFVEQYYGIPVGTSGINFSTVPKITEAMENIYQSWVHGPETPLRNLNVTSSFSRHKEDALKLCLWSIYESFYRPERAVLRGYNPRLERFYMAPEMDPVQYNNYIRDVHRLGNVTILSDRDMQRQLSDAGLI